MGTSALTSAHDWITWRRSATRGPYDLKDPGKSQFTIATVESRRILPSHTGDFVPPWNDVITIAGTEDELKQAKGEELTLRP